MGWTETYNKIAVATAEMSRRELEAGRVEKAQKFAADSAKFAAKAKQNKSDRFKSALPKIGTVIVSTVGGLIAGGPAGAAAGFVGGAKAISEAGKNVTFETPPIVPQPEVPGPTTSDDGSTKSDFWSTGHWVPFALVGGFLFRKQIAKIFKR